jgi:hypothetical protein
MSENMAKPCRLFLAKGRTIPSWAIGCFMLALCFVTQAQQGKGTPAKTSLTGHYEGSAQNKAEEVITVSFDLTEKDGALSGVIHSSHGDFPIVGGSHQGETVKIEFDANGPTGTISLKATDDRLVGTWSTGDDGGPVDVKRVAPQDSGSKGKS